MAENLIIETLEVVVKRNSTDAVSKLDALIERMQKLKTAVSVKNASALNKTAEGITNISTAINSLNMNKLEKLASILDSFSALKGISKKATADLSQVAEAANGVAPPQDNTTDTESTKQNLSRQQKNVENLKKMLAGLKKVGDTAMKPFNKLFKSFARIAMYRAIRTFFSTLTKSIKEGVQNLYQFDKTMNGTFSKSLDNVATSVNYIKNALGASISTILVAAAPLIEQLSEVIADFANGVAVLVANAQGLTSVTIAAKGMKEFAENANKAKSALMGFDELNNIGQANNIQDMFQNVPLVGENGENIVAEFKKKIATISAIVSASLVGIGALLLLFGQAPLGIGMIVAGFAGLYTVAISWGSEIPEKIKSILGIITSIVGAASLAVGIILCCTGVALPLGIGLIAAGAASLGSAVALNWDFLLSNIKKVWAEIEGFFNGTVLTFFATLGNKIKDSFSNAWNTVKKVFEVDIKNTFINIGTNIVSAFESAWNKVKDFFTGTVKNFFTQTIPGFFKNVGVNIANSIIDGLNRLGNFTIPGFRLGAWQIWEDTEVKLFNIPKIPAYATGGFPEDGLFFANSGELVGEFAGGRTAAVNNQQIIEGVSDGVYRAVVAALGEQSNGNQSVSLNLYLDGKQIKAAYDRATYNSGTRIATGGIVVS